MTASKILYKTIPLLFVLCSMLWSEDHKLHNGIQKIHTGPDTVIRALHIGGNWGRNTVGFDQQPQDYYDFLDRVNVNWVGISVALHIDDSMDSTVERKYSGVQIPTFPDSLLIKAIRGLRKRGLNVYLTLALEDQNSSIAPRPVSRWQLGDPEIPHSVPSILPENWPWDTTHILHTQFVRKFWETYKDQAVYYATIAQSEDIGMFSLGTETERLFRTRAENGLLYHYRTELDSMVAAVRRVYSGLLTYDMHYSALVDTSWLGSGGYYLAKDLMLDVIGISAYFPLYSPSEPLPFVPPLDTLKERWEAIFNSYLKRLRECNSDLPIIFLEFGYTDYPESVHQPDAGVFQPRVFLDLDGNSFDDGQEAQANIYDALFQIRNAHPDLFNGAFLWGNDMSSDLDWANSFGMMRTFAIRDKLAEEVIRNHYDAIATTVQNGRTLPEKISLSQNYPNPFNPTTTISYTISAMSIVHLKVYDMLGREIATLAKEEKAAGSYNVEWNASGLPSGVYFYRLSVIPSTRRNLVPTFNRGGQAASYTETRKLLLLK